MLTSGSKQKSRFQQKGFYYLPYCTNNEQGKLLKKRKVKTQNRITIPQWKPTVCSGTSYLKRKQGQPQSTWSNC